MDEETKYVAIAYGVDGFEGDSPFAPADEFALRPVSLKTTFHELFMMWTKITLKEGEMTKNPPVGFWILTEENLLTALVLWGSESSCDDEGGRRSPRVITNEYTKRLCNQLATKWVGSNIQRVEILRKANHQDLVFRVLKLEQRLED